MRKGLKPTSLLSFIHPATVWKTHLVYTNRNRTCRSLTERPLSTCNGTQDQLWKDLELRPQGGKSIHIMYLSQSIDSKIDSCVKKMLK